MTREEKIRDILQVAEGRKSPTDRVYIWICEDGKYKLGDQEPVSEKVFNSIVNRTTQGHIVLPGRHIVLQMPPEAEERALDAQKEQMMVEHIAAKEQAYAVVTEDVECEVVTPEATEPVKPVRINGIPVEELDWNSSDLIGYMFPSRR